MKILITPMNKQIVVRDDGQIEGDFEDLAGWVKSGSHRDQDNFLMWYLFFQEWKRQSWAEYLHDPSWGDDL